MQVLSWQQAFQLHSCFCWVLLRQLPFVVSSMGSFLQCFVLLTSFFMPMVTLSVFFFFVCLSGHTEEALEWSCTRKVVGTTDYSFVLALVLPHLIRRTLRRVHITGPQGCG